MKILKRAMGAIAVLAAVAAGPVAAQTQFERAGAQKDWSVFEAGSGNERVCWIVSKPTKWEARRDGRRVEVKRGDIYLMVANRPAQGVRNEVSMVAGYPFRAGSNVGVEIGANKFTMFTQDQTAWLENPQADAQMIEAMKRGVEAVITGVSGRGTATVDTFSLLGFTAALDEAQRLCG